MDAIVTWISNNWMVCLSIFWVLEKIVKITPFKADDILIDIIWDGIKILVGKKKVEN